MPRPRKCRKVCCLPRFNAFAPTQGRSGETEDVILTVDEYEAVRLIDKEDLSQEECSEYMNVARTTVQQIYTSARKKIAEALVNGGTLRIEGGDYRLCEEHEMYCGCVGCHMRRCRQEPATDMKGDKKMKIAIPLDEDKKNVCVSFGRAPYFLLHDNGDGTDKILDNPAAQAEGGAGIKAAQFIVDSGAEVLITVRCGENAADVFKAADIKIYKSQSEDAKKNIADFNSGILEELTHFHAGYHGIL